MQNTIKSPAIHPICAIFPAMPDDELRALTEPIRLNGLRHPITLYEGKILDGRHRHSACMLAGVEPRYTQFTGDDAAALALVTDENLKRRHLSESQLAIVGSRISTYMRGGDRRSVDFQTDNSPFEKTTEQAASDFESAKPKRIGRWKPLTPFKGRQLELANAAAEAGRLNAEYRKHVAANGVGVVNEACDAWPPEPSNA